MNEEIVDMICESIEKLGLGDADTPMGAIELLALEIRKGFASVVDAINGLVPIEKIGESPEKK